MNGEGGGVSAEKGAVELTEDQYDEVVSWCHRWKCSYLADDYCGCTPDHLDREMADLLVDAVIAPILREHLEHESMARGSLSSFADALEQMSRNLRSAVDRG